MNDSVSLSHRLYRALLRAYPPSFRAEYGDEMALTFRDECRARHRRHGAAGVVGQWVETVPDFVVSVVDEHAQENFHMAKIDTPRALALAGIVGGGLWIAYSVILALRAPGVPGGAYRQTEDVSYLLILATALASAGLAGIVLRPARGWPVVTRGLLLLAVAGGLWPALVSILLPGLFGISLSALSYGWILWVAGYLVMFLGLVIGGLLLLVLSPAQRRWALLFVAWAVTMFLFNTEDLRALFGAAAGLLAILTFALALSSALGRQSEPPVAAG